MQHLFAILRRYIAIAVAMMGLGFATAQAQNGAPVAALANAGSPETLLLDARQAARGLMFAHLTVPVKAGDFALVYPKWIPGEHGPTGPLNDLAELRVSANGHALSWLRDKVDMYAFHVDVPPGVMRLDLDFDVLLNAPGDVMSTKNLALVNWNRALLYQAETNSHQVYVQASILLPPAWGYATALPGGRRSVNRVDFSEVTLATLVDSPLDCGAYYKHIKEWSQNGVTVQMDVFADRPQDLEIPGKLLNAYKNSVAQAFALYDARHFDRYDALLTLSDAIGVQGIEHHQSSDNREEDGFFTEPSQQLDSGDLLMHEFSHSWNGKYRRPADLITPNFQVPMQTDLLWVYEGLNQYVGDLLSFRAGVRDGKSYPEYLADIYASMDTESGRNATPLIDLTTSAPYLYQARGAYTSLRRTASDFYTEGELLWLDADTLIRAQTGGKRSLDDFLRLFAGPPSSGPITVGYTRSDVERLLSEIVPYDWHAFFQRYVYQVSAHPPGDEITRSGWRLVYTSKPNDFVEAAEKHDHSINAWFSLGLNLDDDGTVHDIRQGSAAFAAGMGPGMKVVAVEGQAFSPEVLEFALRSAQRSSRPIAILAEHDKWFETFRAGYHDGPRYPHLVRVPGKPDMLARIMAPHAVK